MVATTGSLFDSKWIIDKDLEKYSKYIIYAKFWMNFANSSFLFDTKDQEAREKANKDIV